MIRPAVRPLFGRGASCLVGVILSLCTGAVLAEAPTPTPAPPSASTPTAIPASRPAADNAQTATIRKTFAALSDDDETVRDAARDWLMGLSDADLPTLKRIVQQNLPLRPRQQTALHDIVTQVFLSGQPLEGDTQRGFMGVRFDPRDEDSNSNLGGVEIRQRIPGFAAFRGLRDGDIIQGIVNQPYLPIRSQQDIQQIVPTFRAGEVVVFEVLREGKRIRVPIRLDARPSSADPADPGGIEIEQRLMVRQEEADSYWEREFEPLLDD